VRSRLAVEIEPKVHGRITELPVRLGQTVKEGDLLVTLASDEVAARVGQAEAALRQAETDFQRVTRCRHPAPPCRRNSTAPRFRLEGARASAAEAKAMLAYARITAPINGVVARKDAEVGDLAMPGKTLLRLEDPAHLRLEAEVPDSVLARVPTGAKLPVRIDSLGLALEGEVVEIAPLADVATRSVRVKLDLPATPGLRSGQFGRLAVPVAEADRLIVPTSAVVQRGQLDLVFVARDGRAQMRLVRPGRGAGRRYRTACRARARRKRGRRRRARLARPASRCSPTDPKRAL